MKLFMVRHGPTHQKGMVGWTDCPADLSDVEAIGRLRAYLPQSGFLISSDLSRAITTADAVAQNHNRLPHDPDLREINFGDWEMKTFDQINTTEPDRIFAFYDNPGATSAPNGDSWNSLSDRVDRAIDALYHRYVGELVICVAHYGVILRTIQRAESQSAYEAFAQKIDNLSVTTFEVTDTGLDLGAINYCP